MLCDKCNTEVKSNNDATILDAIINNNPESILFNHARHLLPVVENGVIICEGSPSRAQYIEGQKRDTRGYKYYPEYESVVREAYKKLLEK
jgi:hypothetical protein